MSNISKFMNRYTEHCTLNGCERSQLLQKVVAAAIAYSSPVLVATPGEITEIYHNLVLKNAIRFISDVNEYFILNTDVVLCDVKLLWEGRFLTLNDQRYVDNFEVFNRSLCVNMDLGTKHDYWVERLIPIINSYNAVLDKTAE